MRPSTRKHPVGSLLSQAAQGDLPTEKDLDRLELPPAARRNLADAALVTVGIKAGGANAQARAFAAEKAEDIIGSLDPSRQRPDYLKTDDTPDDPAGLAALVNRGSTPLK